MQLLVAARSRFCVPYGATLEVDLGVQYRLRARARLTAARPRLSHCAALLAVPALAAAGYGLAVVSFAQASNPCWDSSWGTRDPSLAANVIVLVNQQREAHGLAALPVADDLNDSATYRALHVSHYHDYADNTGVDQTAINACAVKGTHWNGADLGSGSDARGLVEVWMSNTDDRNNILNPYASYIGAGATYSSYYKTSIGYLFFADTDAGPVSPPPTTTGAGTTTATITAPTTTTSACAGAARGRITRASLAHRRFPRTSSGRQVLRYRTNCAARVRLLLRHADGVTVRRAHLHSLHAGSHRIVFRRLLRKRPLAAGRYILILRGASNTRRLKFQVTGP